MQKTKFTLLLMAISASVYAVPPASPARLDAVAERGSHVMPFDLDQTLHVFDKSEHGGIQQVIVKDTANREQIDLIRHHLSALATGFKHGDFSGPTRIHGHNMPGVQQLSQADGRIHFFYQELPNGAQLEYLSEDPALIDAIHRYFNAQLSDHARHVAGGDHSMHHHGHHHDMHH